MNIKYWFPDLNSEGELIAGFGRARLIRKRDGSYELIGGSPEDRTAAGQWISLFFNGAVIREVATAS